jgi:Domain of unknown function (DUF4926)
MTERAPILLDVVALLRDLPEQGLARGDVGAVVDDAGGPQVLVEFADADGETVAMIAVLRSDLLALNYEHLAAE